MHLNIYKAKPHYQQNFFFFHLLKNSRRVGGIKVTVMIIKVRVTLNGSLLLGCGQHCTCLPRHGFRRCPHNFSTLKLLFFLPSTNKAIITSRGSPKHLMHFDFILSTICKKNKTYYRFIDCTSIYFHFVNIDKNNPFL